MKKKKENEASSLVHYVKGSKLPGILIVFVVILSAVLGMKLGSEWQQAKADETNHRIEITSDALHQEIEQIGELSSVSYYYTNMGKFEDAVKLLNIDVPFTTKSFILSYDGEIKAGIHLEEVFVEIIDQVIMIALPEVQILSHEADMDSVTLFDEKNSIFNGLSVQDVTAFISNQQKVMEEKALNNGLLERAEENVKELLTTLLKKYLKENNADDFTYQLEFIQKKTSTE